MADPQTDWLTCGERRSRARRVVEVVAQREEQWRQQLHLRRCRLREMLEEENARHRQELQQRFAKIYEHQKAARMQAVEHEQERREEERRQQVSKADELRRRQQRHVYREEYSRQLQEYLNQTRHLEIQLKNHLREKYGPTHPPGHRQAPTAFSPAVISTTDHSSSADHGHNTREEHVGMWW